MNNLRTKMKEFFNNFIKKYSSLFQEGVQGSWSMMRYLSWFIVTDIMGVWTYLCIRDSKMIEIPMEVAGILMAAILGKVLQKGKEKNIDEKQQDATEASI